jgi:hypothetical protein
MASRAHASELERWRIGVAAEGVSTEKGEERDAADAGNATGQEVGGPRPRGARREADADRDSETDAAEERVSVKMTAALMTSKEG